MIKRFFPGLLSLLKQIRDPRNQRYITYQSQVLLMTGILSSIFYISSMRKTSEGRRRWMIENHGFNTQKNHGYSLEHRFSHNYQA